MVKAGATARCTMSMTPSSLGVVKPFTKEAIDRVLAASWQRCRVHFMRNALAYVSKTRKTMVASYIRTAFTQEDMNAARQQWRKVADALRPKLPKLADLMDRAENDVLERDQIRLNQSNL